MKFHSRVSSNSLVALFTVAVLGGCQIGPRLVPMTTTNYSDAVRVSQS